MGQLSSSHNSDQGCNEINYLYSKIETDKNIQKTVSKSKREFYSFPLEILSENNYSIKV
jgi:hypothetical protein